MRRPVPELFAGFSNISTATWDMFDIPRTAELLQDFRPDAIVHCAAGGLRQSDTSLFEIVKSNVDCTVELFRESCRLDECHFIHVSTGLVYREQGRPLREDDPIDTLHPYGASKAAADTLLRAIAHRLKRHLTVVRPFSFTGVYDGGKRIFPTILQCAVDGKPFSMSSGKQIRDYCAVQDVAEAINLLLDSKAEPGVAVYNVGSGSRLPLRDLIKDIIAQLDLGVEVRFGKDSPPPPEPMHLVADVRRLQNDVGWRSRTSMYRAVWELAQELHPSLTLREPVEGIWQMRAASI
jgi:nucleoside-diphosphate-sugar epimerase